jgi:hypothetical protein
MMMTLTVNRAVPVSAPMFRHSAFSRHAIAPAIDVLQHRTATASDTNAKPSVSPNSAAALERHSVLLSS